MSSKKHATNSSLYICVLQNLMTPMTFMTNAVTYYYHSVIAVMRSRIQQFYLMAVHDRKGIKPKIYLKKGEKIMYSEQFIKTLGLDSKVWPTRKITDTFSSTKVEENISEQSKNHIPTQQELTTKISPTIIRCVSCIYLSGENSCKSKRTVIDDPEAKIQCDFFQNQVCKNCGHYENGLCYFRDGEIVKNPEDECEYDGLEFL